MNDPAPGLAAPLAAPPAALQPHSSRVSLRDRDRDPSPSAASTTTALANGPAASHTHSPAPSQRLSLKPAAAPPPAPAAPAPALPHARWTWHRDVREYLPSSLRRFVGHRPHKPPFEPLPFPPFTWIALLPLKYEVWLLSFIGSFVGIALIEIVMIAGFGGTGTIMIVGSFGASAVLAFATIDSPLSQPRHLVGGQVVSAIVGVAMTRCFRHAGAYRLDETTEVGGLGHVVWINGALSMALALLAMQVTGTTHPPGGATALIASVMPSAVAMSWRYVYIVIISSLLMLGWAMIINNVGRRRYPTYWLSGNKLFVKARPDAISQDELHMAAVEGRSEGFAAMDRALSVSPEEHEREKRESLEMQRQMSLNRSLSRSASRSPTRSLRHHHSHVGGAGAGVGGGR